MAVYLVANIGNRDLVLTDYSILPQDLQDGTRQESRRLGQYLLENYGKRIARQITLPIISPTIHYILAEEGRIDHIILVGSDQKEPSPTLDERARKNWLQDTIYIAQVVRCWLMDEYPLTPEMVECIPVTDNPANYTDMHAFFGDLFGRRQSSITDDDIIYLELAGGTPQMTSMLLIRGVEYFGERAVPLYIAPQFEKPFVLNVGRKLTAAALIRAIKADLDAYSYLAAIQTIKANHVSLQQNIPHYDTLLTLLNYADHRLNFSFKEAAQELAQLNRSMLESEAFGTQLRELEQQIAERPPAWLLCELVSNAEIKLKNGQFADFLARTFRFAEAALRFMAWEWLNVRFSDADAKKLDTDWLDSMPELRDHLVAKQVRLDMDATQFTLKLVNGFLAKQREDANAQAVLDKISQFETLSNLRNRSVIAHDYEGVSKHKLAGCYLAAPEQILSDMRQIAEALTQRVPKRNPFDDINALCKRLLP